MARFISTGIRVLENEKGDLLFSDSGWKTGVKMDFTIRNEMIDRAMEDEYERSLLMKQFIQFMRKHHELRSV